MSEQKDKVLKAMKDAGKPVRPGDVAKSLGMDSKDVSKAIDALNVLGMTSPSRCFVLNRANSRVQLDKDDVAAAAGVAIDLEIPSSRQVPISLNEGRPLVVGNPRSPVARSIARLVERFAAPPVRRPGHR